MVAGIIDPPKQPAEQLPLSIDFTDNLFGGSVSSATVTAKELGTNTVVTGTLISGSPIVASPFVTVLCIGGTTNKTYVIEIRATMTGSPVPIIEDEIIVPVKEITP